MGFFKSISGWIQSRQLTFAAFEIGQRGKPVNDSIRIYQLFVHSGWTGTTGCFHFRRISCGKANILKFLIFIAKLWEWPDFPQIWKCISTNTCIFFLNLKMVKCFIFLLLKTAISLQLRIISVAFISAEMIWLLINCRNFFYLKASKPKIHRQR